jgi:hypothetical protein
MALRKASEVAQELVDRHEHFERDFKAGKAPPKSIVTADRLALVQRLRAISLEWFEVGVDANQAGALANAADILEREINDAAE